MRSLTILTTMIRRVVYGFIEPDDYEMCHDLHGPDDCGVYCAVRGETGGSPYWIGNAERDVCIGDVALSRPDPTSRLTVLFALPNRWNWLAVLGLAGPVRRIMLILRGLLPYPGPGLMRRLAGLFVCQETVNRLAVLGQTGPGGRKVTITDW